jgi:ATP-binding cassette, subfamily B, bacterial
MDNLSGYANPLPFMLRYLRQRLASHVVILASVVAAVACSVGTQYGVKYLVEWFVSRAGPRGRRMAGIRFTYVADNSG